MAKEIPRSVLDEALDALKKFVGLPPYDEGTNIVRGDGYFYNSIMRDFCDPYDITFDELKRLTGFSALSHRWEIQRKAFMDTS